MKYGAGNGSTREKLERMAWGKSVGHSSSSSTTSAFPTFVWGRSTMTYAYMKHGRTLHQPTVLYLWQHPLLCPTIFYYVFLSSFSPVLSVPSPSFLRSVPLFSTHAHTTLTSFPGISLRFPPTFVVRHILSFLILSCFVTPHISFLRRPISFLCLLQCPCLYPVHQRRSYHCDVYLPIDHRVHFAVAQHSTQSLPVLTPALHSSKLKYGRHLDNFTFQLPVLVLECRVIPLFLFLGE